jgi:hypothetical protein
MRVSRARVWRECKPFVGPALIVVVYVIVRLVWSMTDWHGLVTPSGARPILGLVTLAMRGFVLIVVPFAIVYRLVMRLLRVWVTRPTRSDAP